jgi:signal peptidase I
MTQGLYVVKRIIGVPGDHIHLRDGVVYRNGQKLEELFVKHHPDPPFDPYRTNFPAVPPSPQDQLAKYWQLSLPQYIQGEDIVVPPNSYFGMGDNRDVSYDSRYWGFIPQQNVVGRPMFVYWSFETPAGQYEQRGVMERVGNLFHVIIHFFDETRWKRTLKVVR